MIFESIDLDERQFPRSVVLKATGIKAKTLENWVDRGVVPAVRQRPGKTGKRFYCGMEIVAIGVMDQITKLTMMPPAEAREVAIEVVASFTTNVEDRDPERTLIVYWHDGKVQCLDNHPINEGFVHAIGAGTIHIRVPVEFVCQSILSDLVRVVDPERAAEVDRLLADMEAGRTGSSRKNK